VVRIVLDRPSYLDQFGHLQFWVEVVMFGLPVAARLEARRRYYFL
jgi:hypothetical protein